MKKKKTGINLLCERENRRRVVKASIEHRKTMRKRIVLKTDGDDEYLTASKINEKVFDVVRKKRRIRLKKTADGRRSETASKRTARASSWEFEDRRSETSRPVTPS